MGDTDYYYSDSPPREGIKNKNSLHPTPEVEEVKEFTEVSAIHSPLFPSTPQAAIQYTPIVIHTSLPPPPPLTHQTLLLPPPPPPMANVPGFLLNKYAPLALPQVLNDMPQDYLKILPRFNGENEIETQKYLEVFCSFGEKFNVEHLDTVLRLFFQSLDGEARKWFKTLGDHSSTTWEGMEDTFLRKWGEKKDHGHCLTEFNTLKKGHNEEVSEFSKRFNI